MIFNFYENDCCASITLTPETPAETAKLLRLSLNAKAEPVDIHTAFNEDTPSCWLHIKKVKKESQQNSISRKNKR